MRPAKTPFTRPDGTLKTTTSLSSSDNKALPLFCKDLGFVNPWIWGRHGGKEGFFHHNKDSRVKKS
jgi:hypothetical protein